MQRSQVVHFVFKNATTSVISLRGKKNQVVLLVLDKISKNKKDRGRRKKTKMSKGFTVKRSCVVKLLANENFKQILNYVKKVITKIYKPRRRGRNYRIA